MGVNRSVPFINATCTRCGWMWTERMGGPYKECSRCVANGESWQYFKPAESYIEGNPMAIKSYWGV